MQAGHFAWAAGLALALALAQPAWAQVTRTETEWLPQGIQATRIPIRGTSTTFTQGKGTDGNPGRALIYDASVRAEAGETNTSAAFVISSRVYHDAALDGEMDTLSFSQSLYVDTTDAVSTFATARFLVAQFIDGQRVVFAHEVAVAPLFGQWQTISAVDLRESDFARLDLSTGELVADAQPDFDLEFSQFGIGLGAGVMNGTNRPIRERLQVRIDNLSVTVSAVPEPAASAMLLAGLLIVAGIGRIRTSGRIRRVC